MRKEQRRPNSPCPVLVVERDRPQPEVLGRARAVLEAGDLLIYPTETFYALGARALDPLAGRAVRAAKGRDDRKPLPLVVADVAQAMPVCAGWPELASRLAEAFWPGPLTLVLPAQAHVPEEITAGTESVALRVPGAELARRLCALAGPLVSTSANRSGEAPPASCAQALAEVGRAAALALDGGPGGGEPSTIVDLTGDDPRLLRPGAIAWENIRRVCLRP